MVLIHRQNAIREFIDGEAHEREYPAWIDYAGVQGMGIGGTGEAGVQSGLRK